MSLIPGNFTLASLHMAGGTRRPAGAHWGSLANGAIIGMNEKQEQNEIFRTNEDGEVGVDHTDHKYPPWKDAPVIKAERYISKLVK